MKVEIDECLLTLLKRRKEVLCESDLETAGRVVSWSDEYTDLCVSIARGLSVIVSGKGDAE